MFWDGYWHWVPIVTAAPSLATRASTSTNHIVCLCWCWQEIALLISANGQEFDHECQILSHHLTSDIKAKHLNSSVLEEKCRTSFFGVFFPLAKFLCLWRNFIFERIFFLLADFSCVKLLFSTERIVSCISEPYWQWVEQAASFPNLHSYTHIVTSCIN